MACLSARFSSSRRTRFSQSLAKAILTYTAADTVISLSSILYRKRRNTAVKSASQIDWRTPYTAA